MTLPQSEGKSRRCKGCGVPLKPAEDKACGPCATGADFYAAALAFVRTNPKRQRWAR